MREVKRIIFRDYDTNHAGLLTKLKTMRIKQNEFFQFFVEMFITDDPCLNLFREKLIQDKSRLGKRSGAKYISGFYEGQANLNSMNLTQEEREEIFDLLELELGDK